MKQGTKRRRQCLLLALGLALGAGAGAHSDEHLAAVAAPHGGQLRMAGTLHLELVLEPGSVKVYLSDHAFQPVSADGATGSASVSRGGKRLEVPLRPAGGNLLAGKGAFATAPDTRVTVRVRLPDRKAESAEFAPARATPPAAADSHGHEAR